MNNEITQKSHERCHLPRTPQFLPYTHLGSTSHSILVVMGPKVNGLNKERKGCTNNFKNKLEAFVTMVHKNYLLTIAFLFHSSFSFFFFFLFFFLFQFLLHSFFFFSFFPFNKQLCTRTQQCKISTKFHHKNNNRTILYKPFFQTIINHP